jgi:hypothetical protein
MKIYSGQVCLGVCGTPTNLYDDYCSYEEADGDENLELKPIPNLFVGDIVVAVTTDTLTNKIENISGLCVVVEDMDSGKPFVMGLKSIDFSTENDGRSKWLIRKVKGWENCIHGEMVTDNGRMVYRNE